MNAIILSLWMPVAAQQDPMARAQRELRSLEAEIAAYATVDTVLPNPDQLKEWFEVAQEARSVREKYESDLAGLRDRQHDAFEAFRAEALKNQGFTPKVERAAGGADHAETVLEEQFRKKINKLEDAVRKILDDGQVRAFEALTPRNLLNVYIKPKVTEKLPEDLGYFVRSLRTLSDADFDRQRRSLSERFCELIVIDRKNIDDGLLFYNRVAEALAEIRGLEEAAVAAEVPKIVERVRPKSEAERLYGELGALHAQKHGQIGRIGEFLVSPFAVEALAARDGLKVTPRVDTGGGHGNEKEEEPALACCCNPCGCADCACAPLASEIRDLRDDINLLNLYNGLNFTKHQLAHLISANKYAEKERAAAPATAKPSEKAILKYYESLKKIRGSVYGHKPLAAVDVKDLGRDRAEACKGLARLRPDKKGGDDVSRAVDSILYDGQKEVLIDYAPCLIPPQNLRDPVRVGQAQETGPALKELDRLRAIPNDRFNRERQTIVEDLMARAEKHGGEFPESERPKVRWEVDELIVRARLLSDVDYELSKADLAGQMTELLDRSGRVKERLKDLVGEENVLLGKISAFLVHPRSRPLLEARLDQLKNGQAGNATDLDAISPAASCKDGKCAIDD